MDYEKPLHNMRKILLLIVVVLTSNITEAQFIKEKSINN